MLAVKNSTNRRDARLPAAATMAGTGMPTDLDGQSAKNRALLRLIVERHPKSVSELAILAGRAEQNVLRTLHKLSAVGLVRLDKGEGRAYQPVVAGRKVHFEIDLLT